MEFVCLSVHPSVLQKIKNNFYTSEQIWIKFSGLARLVCNNFWVGSTPTQSPLVGTGLHPVLLPEVEQVCSHWCYRVVSYHFGKLLLSQTAMAELTYDVGPGTQFLGYKGWGRESVCCGCGACFVWYAFFTIKNALLLNFCCFLIFIVSEFYCSFLLFLYYV